MSSVANLIATIETEMEADVSPEAGVNPEHLRMVEALLFAAQVHAVHPKRPRDFDVAYKASREPRAKAVALHSDAVDYLAVA